MQIIARTKQHTKERVILNACTRLNITLAKQYTGNKHKQHTGNKHKQHTGNKQKYGAYWEQRSKSSILETNKRKQHIGNKHT